MEHLVVLPERALRRLVRRRTPVLIWTRRRREPPVGAVHTSDILFFKTPGGDVLARAEVGAIRERADRGKYVVRLRLRRAELLLAPFPIVKRDRRSWVVCVPPSPRAQQRLLSLPEPALTDLLQAVSRTYRRLPSARTIERAAVVLLEGHVPSSRELAGLALLVLLLAVRRNVSLGDELAALLREQVPSRVMPLAVFRKRR